MKKIYEIKNYWHCGKLEFSSIYDVECTWNGKEVKSKILNRCIIIQKAPEDLMKKNKDKMSFSGTPSKLNTFLKKWGYQSEYNDDSDKLNEAIRRFNEDLTELFKKELIEFLDTRGLKLKMSLDVAGWGEPYGDASLFLAHENGDEFPLINIGSANGDIIETLSMEEESQE